MTDAPNMRPDAFVGAAEAYARFRPPYPVGMLHELLREASVSREGRVLDLACGPGRVTLGLAADVDEVWALDLEPEMVAYGQADARRRGLANIRWLVGPAEDLEAPAASFDLITIGEAFHRLDQPVIARLTHRWLKSGGALATLGSRGPIHGPERWQRAATEVAHRWANKALGDGLTPSRAGVVQTPESDAAVLAAAGFAAPIDRHFFQPHTWTFESVRGYFESTSIASRHALGALFDAFADDLKTTLQTFEDAGRLHEQLRFGYTLYRKA